ncbi:hypothetical protein OsJ_30380 [Oryza sativa Japonica Group]|uniref:DUF2828 domain-containing protein n=2 Tax=Oryza sativa TaxID=4530 RepID=B9G556_ORYSJ|nr:hypothetical protein OsJ_30380 [Oryza sativa Japonica Group]
MGADALHARGVRGDAAVQDYKGAFEKHDKSGVAEFLDEVRTGNARVHVGAAMPHELVAAALKHEHD